MDLWLLHSRLCYDQLPIYRLSNSQRYVNRFLVFILCTIFPLKFKEPWQFPNSIPIRSRARDSKDPNLWPHSAAECDRPGVMFWVWVQFARAHKSVDKCGGNSNSGWLAVRLWQPWVLGYNAYACSACFQSAMHLAFVCTAHTATRNRWAAAGQARE